MLSGLELVSSENFPYLSGHAPHAMNKVPSPLDVRRARRWPGAILVAIVAGLAFGGGLASEPAFADESAYYSQAYFAELFAKGRWNDPLWLSYPAYDLPPLPKYLIGGALWLGGRAAPGPVQARRWYQNTSSRFDRPGGLTTARMPIVLVGVLGCLAVYGMGCLVSGSATGLVAAGLMIVNPLYSLHARRAMSDVPCEAFLDVAFCLALCGWARVFSENWRWSTLFVILGSGIAAGLSILSKMSGVLFFPVVGVWMVLAIVCSLPRARKLLLFQEMDRRNGRDGTDGPGGSNPFLTTRPSGRLDDPGAGDCTTSRPSGACGWPES